MQKDDRITSAGTAADSSTKDAAMQVSQHSSKPDVGGSFLSTDKKERVIKFRGKRVDNGEWVYGFYGVAQTNHGIWKRIDGNEFPTWYQINPESIGQYTGLTDKKGIEIFEGDILCVITKSLPIGKDASGYTFLGVVKFEYGEFVISFKEKFGMNNSLKQWALNHSEIIGNVCQNRELMTDATLK